MESTTSLTLINDRPNFISATLDVNIGSDTSLKLRFALPKSGTSRSIHELEREVLLSAQKTIADILKEERST